ncbi:MULTISPECIES: malto-oligosyltrehalose synthase [Streptomyces]|uniref:Malto-oligosyltrehalose synthase n=2 Tax=Streptomyces TaxID=1883 RepID=A0A100Y5R3_9ACTN|nr:MULTISPECIES: malto-oligosyltrehalose synthase [Streptomyces]KUH38171.1 malto-oligosyltrehalose synthase [Streptomyces kanasensis]UUS33544.1 malto-oligosyltrehalose synthase [Streptomyces changanensis]
MTSHTPLATYRLQLQPDFPFRAAAGAVPHLASLGVSHLHLSPVLEAVPGSTHGYDVTDHGRVREELGGEAGLRDLARTARDHGLGLVVDLVPNHMAAALPHNRALWEVLRDGPASPYARWFDIDWEAGGGRVLLPVLPQRIGELTDDLRVDADAEVLRCGTQVFPLRPGTAGLPLAELLDAQWYRPAWWRLARTELNYRRFFTISDLIGVRVEDPEVFEATHAKILELVRDGVVDGLRIDHPDGLADPEAYLRTLEAATGGACWTVVEKILTGDERLPSSWPVAGTTGYDALRRIDGLFVDGAGAEELADVYRRFASPPGDRGGYWEATARRAAYRVVTHELAAEVAYLTRTAERVCAAYPGLRDHAPWALRAAVRELLIRVPVYRPYPQGGAEEVLTEGAARAAKETFTVPEEAAAVDVVRELALGRLGDGPDQRAFRARFAQTSSALRAKSVEDTAFYRYVPLLSANEVGGEPGRPAVSPEEFHAYCARLARDWPATGTVLSTHDTKRSADVRARIAVLSQCPGRWAKLLGDVARVAAPDGQLAWSAWQTSLGLGRPARERLEGALLKAAREAGLHTGWTEQDAVYEEAVAAFVTDGPAGPPQHAVAELAAEVEPHAWANVLGAALVHLTMPGVPDLYQGTEAVYEALVDPDNRAPFTPPRADRKTALTRAALGLRRRHPEVFGPEGTYTPLAASGEAADHCVAFVRSDRVVTAVTRLSLRLAERGGWGDTALTLPEGRWADALDGGRVLDGGRPVPLAELFAERPVALLSRTE